MRYLLLFLLLAFNWNTGATQTAIPEICDNQLDDDGDGLIDCFDYADCPCNSDHDCTLDSTEMPRELDLFWQSTANYSSSGSPIVGNLNPWADNISEIVVAANTNSSAVQYTYGLYILKGDGSNQNNPDFLEIGNFQGWHIPMPAMADLDNNGIPELFIVCPDKKIRIYTNYSPAANPPMQLWATSADTCQLADFCAYSADFNSDGLSEIYAGNEVFGLDMTNPAAPVLTRLAKGVGPTGGLPFRFSSSIAADLLTPVHCNGDPDCDGLEIAAGYGIYSIDIDPNDGDGMEIKLQRNIRTSSGQPFSDGFTAVADLNHDQIPEVIVPGIRNQEVGLYIWNRTGFWRFISMTIPIKNYTISPGACSVGNVFDDRTQGFTTDWPEVMFRYGETIGCFNLHAANNTWWINKTLLTDDNSGHGVVSTYDFDNNGLSELIVLDEDLLRICYGGAAPFPSYAGANRTIAEFPSNGTTGFDIPVVADVDGNGNPEIIVHNFIGSTTSDIRVIRPKNPDYSRWLPARNLWNQYSYHVVNILDDLSVPKVQQAGYLEAPAPGSGKRPFNIFLSQIPAYHHPDATPYFPSADLSVEVTEVLCLLPTFQVSLEVCNLGDSPSADTTTVRFYRNGSPFVSPFSNNFGGGTFTVSTEPIAPDSCVNLTISLPVASGNVYAVLNEEGLYPTPLPAGDTAFYRPECNLSNNVAIFKLELSNGLPLSLGQDRVICSGETISLAAPPGFNSYLWQNGATAPTIQASGPGLYWVETRDLCFNIKRDSVLVVAGETSQTIQASACTGTFYSFQGQNILAGTSQTLVLSNAAGCDSTVVVQVAALPLDTTAAVRQICPGDSTLVFGNFVSTAGLFFQTFSNSAGCDSTHLVTVELLPQPVPGTELRQICPGDSTLVFGSFVKTAGVFSQNFSAANGCDSTHTVTVDLLPQPAPGQEMRQICPGDSTLVFGNFVKTAGVFSQNFSAANGCDSTHTVTVALLAQPAPSQEIRQICPGDSTLVFGNFVKTAGVFSQNFASVNGCDSTHTVTVALLAQPAPSQEIRQICPGDSTLVFGNFVKTAGVFSQNFSAANGCDSTHTVTVALLAQPAPSQEMRQICPGDSTLVFGNFVKTAGVFSQNFVSVNGCDSTHIVTVALLTQPAPGQELRQICPGDSTLVFGNFVKTAGVFSQNFVSVNDCDSTHIVTVALLIQPAPGQELRQICPGDSTLVFGNFVKTAGVFSQNFVSVNGCDSTHTVTVALLAQPAPSQEMRQICPGDSTLVFGNFVKTAGVFSQNFAAASGCDSTHTVTVALLPQPVPSAELRQICPGDSTLVFGNFVKAAGVFSQNFAAASGCDSTHTVTVALLAQPVPSQEMRQICAGDSTLVFGNFVKAAGVFSQNFAAASGCDSTHTVTVETVAQYTSYYELALCPGDSVLVLGNWIRQPGVVQALIINPTGCDTVATYDIQGIAPPVLQLQLTQPDAVLATGSVQVLGSGGAQYSLDGVQYSSQNNFEGLLPGNYVLYQLFEECIQVVPFEILPFVPEAQQGVYIPNILAPGSANGNDRFTVFAAPGHVLDLHWLRIYDRWGSLVFERRHFLPNAPDEGWDGLIGGRAAAPGVYFWQLMLEYSDGTTEVKKGDVTVVR